MANPNSRIRGFYEETIQELKKCTWPTSKELTESTTIVVMALIILTVFIWVVDMVSQQLIRFFILS